MCTIVKAHDPSICYVYARMIGMTTSAHPDVREAKLFRNNRSQAIRIPAEFEMPGDRVLVRRDGPKLIIEPSPRVGLADVLRSLNPLPPDDAFPDDLNATLLPIRDIEL